MPDAPGNTDIVVGIPSFNVEDTIGNVLYQTAAGLAEHFPGKNALIVVSDGGSTDGTQEACSRASLPGNLPLLFIQYPGPRGKGSAVRAIFEKAAERGARAVLLLDSDMRSITPDWVGRMLGPVYRGYDLVTPYYARHRFDGTITNSLVHPLVAALYGTSIRQPIGGDFALSGNLIRLLLSLSWRPEAYLFGIDIFITLTALSSGLRIAQACLGVKAHRPKDPAKPISGMFMEVAGSLFALCLRDQDLWLNGRKNHKAPILGGPMPDVRPRLRGARPCQTRNLREEWLAV